MQRMAWRLGLTSLATLIVASGVVSMPGGPSVAAAATDDSTTCDNGFRQVRTTRTIIADDVVMVSPRRALIAGGENLGWGRKAATIVRYEGRTFKPIARFAPTRDTGFVAIDRIADGPIWAVGFKRTQLAIGPLAARKLGNGSWKGIGVALPSGRNGSLTDIAASSKQTWAVGYLLRRAGRRSPWALQRKGGRWVARNPGLRSGENGVLTAVSTGKKGGTWVAGTTYQSSRIRPYIARRSKTGWDRSTLPDVGDASLTAVRVNSSTNGWAVGYRTTSSGPRPLVLRWDGTAWTIEEPPPMGPGGGVLLGLTMTSGKPVVTGASWGTSRSRFRPLVATLGDAGWMSSNLTTSPSHAAMISVDRDPMADGLAVGSGIGIQGLVARTCLREPSTADLDTTIAIEEPLVAGADPGDSIAIAEPTEEAPAASSKLLQSTARTRPIRDRAAAKGLPSWSSTWSAVVDDFDDDGRDDIFLGRHGARARLYLDKGKRYRDADIDFGTGDRHGCASADIDGSGLPDLYCNFGATGGNAVKANQLWLDPGGPEPTLETLVGGVPEPLGRGRHAAFLDADADGTLDLFVGQKQGRVDGQLSPNRVYLGNGDASFSLYGGSGIQPDLGSAAVDTGDFDRDGRTDILHTYHDQHARSGRSGLKLYRNTESGFKDVARKSGIRSIGEVDAELVRLNGDRRPDLVQLSSDRIRISLQRDGRFESVFERRITHAVAVATGDMDGDGDRDLYVLRQKDSAAIRDLVLLNNGNGRSYRVIAAPSVKGGLADDVVAVDHNQNGTTDFLTLNGRGPGGGPVQLMTMD